MMQQSINIAYKCDVIFASACSGNNNTTLCDKMKNKSTTTLYIMLKILVFFIITLSALLYMRVDILLTCGKHLYGCTMSLRREVWYIILVNEKQKYHNVGTIPKSNIKIVERGKILAGYRHFNKTWRD
jgi:hypothetical protein